jgi:hypothetical protein
MRNTLWLFVAAACLLASCSVVQGTRIEQAVVKALAADQRTTSYSFEVSYQQDGTVVITGELFSPAEVDAVTEIASAVPGVKRVENHCTVPEPDNGMLQDTTVPQFF